MDKLRRHIQTHRAAFETDAPPGHDRRFLKKLKKQQQRSLFGKSLPALKIAGVVLLFILSGLWILEHTHLISPANQDPQITEYMEAENYYATLVSNKYNQLLQMQFIGDSLQKQIILNELGNMDSVYYSLQKELKMNPGDERILQAMVEYYQTKLEAMNTIINQLSQIQNLTKQNNHEKTNL